MLTGDDNALAAVRLEVFGGDLGEFRGFVRQSGRVRGWQTGGADGAGDRESESFDVAGPDRQAVIGLGAGRRQRTLGHVEPVHLLRSAGQAATVNKIA